MNKDKINPIKNYSKFKNRKLIKQYIKAGKSKALNTYIELRNYLNNEDFKIEENERQRSWSQKEWLD